MFEETTTSKALSKTSRFSSRSYLQAVEICMYNRICQRYYIGKLVLTPRRSEDEEQIDLDPSSLHLSRKPLGKCHNESLLQLTENHEKLIHKASERAEFARTVENRQFYITNESFVMDENSSTLLCREYSDQRNSQRNSQT